MKYIILIISAIALAACSKKETEPVSSTYEVHLTWPGASAEQIESFLEPLSNLKMAVIDDEQAKLYHFATIEQTMTEIEKLSNRPYGLTFSPPKDLGKSLPEKPVTKKIKRIEWTANTQAIAKNTIVTSELLDYLKQLEIDIDNTEKIANLSFQGVALSELVDHQIINFDRPIVINPTQ